MKRISILTPSRGRPARFCSMLASAVSTVAHPEHLEIGLLADEDDPMLADYERAHSNLAPRLCWMHVAKRMPVPKAINVLAHEAGGEILMMCADDALFRTSRWDELVRGVFEQHQDGLVIACPSNGDRRQRVNHWFAGREWLGLFGYLCPPFFEHFSADQWVEEVAQRCGRLVYMDDFLLEHMHAKYGKAPNDETYTSKRQVAGDGTNMSGRDAARYAELTGLRLDDELKLKRAIGIEMRAVA